MTRLLFCVILIFPFHSIHTKTNTQCLTHYENVKASYEKQYNFFVNYIKEHEGFSSIPYLCAGGFYTIGYGHKIKNGENYKNITKQGAHALLLIDFENAILVVEKDKIPFRLRLPVAHFIYCLGSGNYAKSTFRKFLLKKKYSKAQAELLKWSYIGTRKSPYLLKMRKVEASFF